MKTNKIHHLGKVVSDIKEALAHYRSLGFLVDEEIYTDTEQKVRVGKVDGGSCFIELLEPLDETSPIARFSRNRTGEWHHVCIKVENIEAYIAYVKEAAATFRLTRTTRSVWDGRPVCFIGTHDREIIELIE